ncbi:MAG: autoinducer binding domain-containing protein [Pseudomonadota bacterium]
MTRLILEYFRQALNRITAPDEVTEALGQLCADLGLAHMGLLAIAGEHKTHLWGALPAAFITSYLQDQLQKSDPAILACLPADTPVDWSALPPPPGPQQYFQSLGSQGVSIPLHGPNRQLLVLSAASDAGPAAWGRFMQRRLVTLTLAAHYLHGALTEQRARGDSERHPALSPRETDALRCLGMGMSRSKVAVLLNISEHTLRAYIENARFKLGCRNTMQAVAMAAAGGLIEIDGPALSGLNPVHDFFEG